MLVVLVNKYSPNYAGEVGGGDTRVKFESALADDLDDQSEVFAQSVALV